jgi:hypothetical protein
MTKESSHTIDVHYFDQLTRRDFDNGAIRDEIRNSLKLCQKMVDENKLFRKLLDKLRFQKTAYKDYFKNGVLIPAMGDQQKQIFMETIDEDIAEIDAALAKGGAV